MLEKRDIQAEERELMALHTERHMQMVNDLNSSHKLTKEDILHVFDRPSTLEEAMENLRKQISEESYRRNQEIFAWINSSQERPELYTGSSRSANTIQEALGNSGSKEV